MIAFLNGLNRFVWGIPALILTITVGVLLSIRTGWVQFRLFPAALRAFFKPEHKEGGISPYKALCTALAATVGTGNLAGVAGAITIGGPGAIFWMWVCGFLGMATKFAEATLSVRYRVPDGCGGFTGGPMYMVQRGLGSKWKPLAAIYCFFGVVAAFGVGSATQINAVLGGIHGAIASVGGDTSAGVDLLIGIFLAILSATILLGGANRIGDAAALLVPFAAVFYLVLCVGVLCLRANQIPDAIHSIFVGAFSPKAVTGGVVGSAFVSLRIGSSRGVFTNEAGMGTAGMAHASAQVNHPVKQGLMGIMEVFLDTIVICTLTALVILCSGIPIPYGEDLGVQVTADAFSYVYGNWVNVPLAVAICCFAFATIIGWGLYGVRCAEYLFGTRMWKCFAVLQGLSVILGAVLRTGTVWSLSETANGLMAIPNLIILICLCPELTRLVKEFKKIRFNSTDKGGTYENIRQCQSLQSIAYAEVSSSGSEGQKCG